MKLRLIDGPVIMAEGEKYGEDDEYVYLENPILINVDNSTSQFRGIFAIPKKIIKPEEVTTEAGPEPRPKASRRRQKQLEPEQ
ncbi:MAG: hypothetical protein QXQ37_00680 [Nitrososphaerota archaeon]